jgi:hypothetical protein
VGSIPVEVIVFFNRPNPSSWTMALGLNYPPTEVNTRNLFTRIWHLVCKADNLTAICEWTV